MVLNPASPLTEAVRGAEFGSQHARVIAADIEHVWPALLELRWSDLRFSKPLLVARGFGVAGVLGQTWLQTFGPVSHVVTEPPRCLAFVMIGQPWSPRPGSRPVDSIEQARDFDEPGWLKYGMDWRLTALPEGRTLVETRTLCEPTDASARRRFALYWTLIRLGSGLIRSEALDAIGRDALRRGQQGP